MHKPMSSWEIWEGQSHLNCQGGLCILECGRVDSIVEPQTPIGSHRKEFCASDKQMSLVTIIVITSQSVLLFLATAIIAVIPGVIRVTSTRVDVHTQAGTRGVDMQQAHTARHTGTLQRKTTKRGTITERHNMYEHICQQRSGFRVTPL